MKIIYPISDAQDYNPREMRNRDATRVTLLDSVLLIGQKGESAIMDLKGKGLFCHVTRTFHSNE